MISQFRSDDFLSIGTAISSHHNIQYDTLQDDIVFLASTFADELNLDDELPFQ
jgi:hypothetical protein